MSETLRRQIVLACTPGRAFRIFTEQVDLWWPRGHRRNRDSALRFELDRLVELLPDGSEWIMAGVRVSAPPDRLELDWYPGSPQAPTNVDIAFATIGDGTLVTIVHRPLNAGTLAVWAERVALFGEGWESVLAALHCHINKLGDTGENP